ncbi:MAG: ABC transporter permease [Bacteroidaceae bacterium]|jgi:lipoprotein-releasing system permease protein|nr:ABC transporter permease [Bacteroidaceae bacterium]
MRFPFYIARRYLFTKKSHNVINVISGISVCGVIVSTAALVCVLSVFNGFQGLVAGLFTAFDPELKVVPAEGKFVAADEPELEKLKECAFLDAYSEIVEDAALVVANNQQVMVRVKGVDDNFTDVVDIEETLYGNGSFRLHHEDRECGVFGLGVLNMLGLTTDFVIPVDVYAPRKGERINLNDPRDNFNNEALCSSSLGFMVKQDYDSQFVITSIAFARRLFERQGYVSALELKVADGFEVEDAKREAEALLGSKYKVLDRYEQQSDTYRIMEIEKLVSYIFLTFILAVACFNIIGSLSMLIIDKKKDVATLRSLGATDGQISDIFMMEGCLIAAIGAVGGTLLGLTACLLQQEFGLVSFGTSEGSYIIDAYPVEVELADIVMIFFTVIVVGALSVWYPARFLSRKFTK